MAWTQIGGGMDVLIIPPVSYIHWMAKTAMPTARSLLAAAAPGNGKLYAVGGWDASSNFATNEEYDPSTNSWTAKADMPTARRALAAAAPGNGKLYAVGGYTSAVVDTNEEYDPSTNTWTAKADMPTARFFLAAAAPGYGTSIDTTLTDDTGDSVKMVYDAQGAGTITHANLQALLQQPGIWQARVRIKVDNTAGTADLLQIGVYNVSAAAWAKTRPGGTVDAVITLKASDLATTFGDKIVEFYWNGQDQLELRIIRLTTDTATTVWVDRVVYRSTFSKDTGEGKAPVGARVTVEPATAVLINVSATLTIAPGYNANSVKSAVQDNIAAYIKSLAFTSDNDVRYVRIGQAILDTPGVTDYQNLLVNGGTANVTVGDQEVAVVGSVNLT